MFKITVFALIGAFAVIMTPSVRYTNCGGNSAALSNVRTYTLIARMAVEDRQDREFLLANATRNEREQIADVAHEHWTRGAHYLASKAPVAEYDLTHPRLIIVCDKAYNNVPQRRFFSAPYTHAAGYSDSSTKLITVEEFKALDLSGFVQLDQLFPKEP